MIPRLSPKKTIEGSIGGIVLGSVLGLVFAYFAGILAHHWIIVPAIIVMTMTSQIGDLIFSAIKRYFEVKDYSKLLPGHCNNIKFILMMQANINSLLTNRTCNT